jgi:phenylacetate-CoA ligase
MRRPFILFFIKKTSHNQWNNYDELKQEQEKQLKHLIEFAYKNVPYYHKLFKDLGLLTRDVQTISNLEKTTCLTKDTIREHWEEFKPANLPSLKYYSRATGGYQPDTLQYRLSKADRFLEGALSTGGGDSAGLS